jgi:hypothetical protein
MTTRAFTSLELITAIFPRIYVRRYEAPPGARVMSVLRGRRIFDCRGKTNQPCHSENCGAEMDAEYESGTVCVSNGAALTMWIHSPPAVARVHGE